MSKQLFTIKQQNELKRNPHVKQMSDKAITYTDPFKEFFIEAHQQGKLPREIFQEAGFTDARKQASGRALTRVLSSEERIKRLEAKVKCLEVENDFLKTSNNSKGTSVTWPIIILNAGSGI